MFTNLNWPSKTFLEFSSSVFGSILSFILYFFFLKYIDYAITVVPIFSPFAPLHPVPPFPPAIPPLRAMYMGHAYKFFSFSISYTILNLFCLSCTYQLCFLFPIPFLPFSLLPLPADNPPCDLHFCDSVPVLVVCLGGRWRRGRAKNWKLIWKNNEGNLPQSGERNIHASPGSSENCKEVGPKEEHTKTNHN